jgi:hypothetical protein
VLSAFKSAASASLTHTKQDSVNRRLVREDTSRDCGPSRGASSVYRPAVRFTLILPCRPRNVCSQWRTNGGFRAKAKNKGEVSVSIASRNTKCTVNKRDIVAPGATQTLSFQADSAALLRDGSTTKARLDLHVTGEVPSSMDYEKPEPTTKN